MSHNSVLVCVICSRNFTCTQNTLDSVIIQEYTDYDFLLLGEKKYIVSFERLFEIINFSVLNDKTEILLSDQQNDIAYYVKQATTYAQEKKYKKVCILSRNVRFHTNNSLSYIVKNNTTILDKLCIHTIKHIDTEVIVIYMSLSRISKPAINKASLLAWLSSNSLSTPKHYIGTISKNEKSQIKIVFFANSYSIWPSLQTLYEAAISNSNISVDLVHVNYQHFYSDHSKTTKELSDFKSNGYINIIEASKYKLEVSKPDIAIFGLPYSNMEKGYNIEEVIRIVPRCIYIPYGFHIISNWPELIRLRYKIAMMYLAWIVFYPDTSERDFACKYTWNKGNNIVTLGLPRIDLILSITKNNYYSEYNEKIHKLSKGRKIILWNTHHSINSEGFTFSAWKQFGNYIIDYVRYNQEVFLLWRPHPLFYGALKQFLGNERYKEFFSSINNCENIYIDNEASYLPSFSAADIMLSDPSSLAKEFIYTDKPVVVTVSAPNIIENLYPYNCLYICENPESARDTIERLLINDDPKRESRKQYINSVISYDNNTTIGETLLNYMLNKYYQETTK